MILFSHLELDELLKYGEMSDLGMENWAYIYFVLKKRTGSVGGSGSAYLFPSAICKHPFVVCLKNIVFEPPLSNVQNIEVAIT